MTKTEYFKMRTKYYKLIKKFDDEFGFVPRRIEEVSKDEYEKGVVHDTERA